ncbi:MAG: hypothetical protein RR906_02765 [Acetivibrio sp.]
MGTVDLFYDTVGEESERGKAKTEKAATNHIFYFIDWDYYKDNAIRWDVRTFYRYKLLYELGGPNGGNRLQGIL